MSECRKDFALSYWKCFNLAIASTTLVAERLKALEIIGSQCLDHKPSSDDTDFQCLRCPYYSVLEKLIDVHRVRCKDLAELFESILAQSYRRTKFQQEYNKHSICRSVGRPGLTQSERDADLNFPKSHLSTTESAQQVALIPQTHRALLEYDSDEALAQISNASAGVKVFADRFDRNPLHMAAELKEASFIKSLRTQEPELFEDWKREKDVYGLTPLATAVMQKDLTIVQALQCEEDPTEHIMATFSKESILDLAVDSRSLKVVDKILSLLAHDTGHNRNGRYVQRALKIALKSDSPHTHMQVLHRLLEHCTRPGHDLIEWYREDRKGSTGYESIISLLMKPPTPANIQPDLALTHHETSAAREMEPDIWQETEQDFVLSPVAASQQTGHVSQTHNEGRRPRSIPLDPASLQDTSFLEANDTSHAALVSAPHVAMRSHPNHQQSSNLQPHEYHQLQPLQASVPARSQQVYNDQSMSNMSLYQVQMQQANVARSQKLPIHNHGHNDRHSNQEAVMQQDAMNGPDYAGSGIYEADDPTLGNLNDFDLGQNMLDGSSPNMMQQSYSTAPVFGHSYGTDASMISGQPRDPYQRSRPQPRSVQDIAQHTVPSRIMQSHTGFQQMLSQQSGPRRLHHSMSQQDTPHSYQHSSGAQ